MHERTELDQSEVKITCKAIICCGKVTGGLSRDCFEPGTVEDVCLQGYSRRSQGLKRILTPSVQSSSVTQLCLTLCDPMDCNQASLSNTNSQELLKLMSIKSVMSSNHLVICHPLLLLPSIFPSIRVFFNESVLHIRLLKYWNFSFSISSSNEYLGLISFRMRWLDHLAVQQTLKSLLQHNSSKASVLWCSAFFMVQLTSIYDY